MKNYRSRLVARMGEWQQATDAATENNELELALLAFTGGRIASFTLVAEQGPRAKMGLLLGKWVRFCESKKWVRFCELPRKLIRVISARDMNRKETEVLESDEDDS